MVLRLVATEDTIRSGSLIANVRVEDAGVGHATRW